MPSKLGPHFIGTPGLPRWLEAGTRVYKFDPSSLGASEQIPPGPLVVGKLDQKEDRLDLTDWKHYMNAGGTPATVAAHRFNVQRNIFVGANKPRVDRYLVNGRIDAWEDDNEVVPDNPDEARWYASYCIEMMRLYESIGKKRANFCFAVGTPDIRPGDAADVWPHLLPAVRHARDHGHYLALHEYMGYEADLGVGWKQIDGQRRPLRRWHGRTDAAGNPDESYPYGYVALRYRLIYGTYFRPEGLHDVPLLITECGCDSVETVTPAGGTVGTWTEQRAFWAQSGRDPEAVYAGMLKWYDQHLRQDEFVKGAMIFTVGSVGIWAKWDIAGTRVEDEILRHIKAEREQEDTVMTDSIAPVIVSPTTTTGDAAEAAGFASDADLDRVVPGATIRATWTFRNSGPTTWDSRYRLIYSEEGHPETAAFSRTPLGAAKSSPITELGAATQVRPGESASLTLTFAAPTTLGTHATNWQLAGPDGRRFGPIRWLRAVVVAAAEKLRYDLLGFRNSAGDFNNLQPGRQFSGVWTIRNSGDRAWNGDFRVAYVDSSTADTAQTPRNTMGARSAYSLREVSGKQSVAPGETIEIRLDLVAPQQPGAYAFHWQLESNNGEPFGGVRWLRIGVAGIGRVDDDTRPPVSTDAVQFGMNINPEAHSLDVDRLGGLDWVRWVFWASRLKLSPEEAYQRKYRSLIQTYAAVGTRSLVILHQDTEWGNAPWQNGGWEQYAETFAQACGRVAAACAEFGDRVAYQIFNEQDSGPDNHSAIGIAAENYAIVLDRAQEAIRRSHPGAVVVIGGLNTGPDNAVRYVRAVQAKLGGRLPIDALAVHPYGRFVKKILFNYGSIGKLADSLNRFRAAFPNKPLWITEVGVANDSPIGPEHYADIGVYVREVVNEVADNFADYVPVLIWFGWTDLMRNAGMLTADGKPKPHVFDAFEHMKARGKAGLESLAAEGLESLEQFKADFLSFGTTLTNHTAVPAGTTFTNRWRFRNSGVAIWGDGFRLVYTPDGAGSDPLMDNTDFDLAAVAAPAPVLPGAETEITLTMTAPAQFGRTYRSRWQLRDPDGVAFGHLFAEITVVPAPTSGTGARTASMLFLRDHTVPDGTQFVSGIDFHKQWAVRNTGVRHWGSGFRLVFVQGDVQMARGVSAHIVPEARPGDEVILSIPMTAPPAQNGRSTPYSSLWRMQDDHGAFFGDPVWVKIVTTPGVPVVDGQPPAGQGTALGRLLNDPSAWHSQLDARWARVTVGHGPQRVEAWGCLMTCMAMALTAYGARFNPLELNERLKTEGDNGFIGSNVQFIAPTMVLAGLKQGKNLRSFEDSEIPFSVWTGENPIARIDTALAAGQIVLAQVDTKPNDGLFDSNIEQHWVILVQRTPAGDDYLILDPVIPADQVRDQPRSLMVKYGNRIAGRSNEQNLRNAIKSTLVYHM
jgi:hypothetical protein